jgi:hypothetical protein
MHPQQLRDNLALQCHDLSHSAVHLLTPTAATIVYCTVAQQYSTTVIRSSTPIYLERWIVESGSANDPCSAAGTSIGKRPANAMDVRRLCKWTPKSKLHWQSTMPGL